MNDFSELEDRLDRALESLSEGGNASVEQKEELSALNTQVTDLQGKLTAARAEQETANSQLEKARAHAKSLKETASKGREDAAENTTALEKQITALKSSQEDALSQRDKARLFSRQLKEQITELRKKNENMVGDPTLINSGLEQELAELKEQRNVDLEEVNTILSRLTPLVEGN
ncbi:MAG: hypothetical protein GY947_21765 [Rhodobacteraceae bacterium]|nr:hypothetical protein [Paracoccaceae bacterium]